jgi:hypothetical protein
MLCKWSAPTRTGKDGVFFSGVVELLGEFRNPSLAAPKTVDAAEE